MSNAGPTLRAVAWITRWCDFYTRGLPDDAAATRREELACDLADQVEWGTDRGVASRRIARSLYVRAVRGAPADLSWRLQQRSGSGFDPFALRPFAIGLLAATAASGFAALGVALLAVVREVEQVGDLGAIAGRAQLLLVIAAIAVILAEVLLARPRTRSLGALWMLAAVEVVIFIGLPIFASTARVLSLTTLSPAWASFLTLAGLGVGMFYLVGALWWLGAGSTGTGSARSTQ